ncbi:MAG: DUF4276 family protein [Verrucomicrobia bacterium]|nr:DUF4276 family protein [Verrucomicrobiota bacterium]
MKRLVLMGEGHGEHAALPGLATKVLRENGRDNLMFVDGNVVRAGNPFGLLKFDKEKDRTDTSSWVRYLRLAASRPALGGVLAVFDGDGPCFPAGSKTPFCAAAAARLLAREAVAVGAGKSFSLAVVFACVEYETWIIASVESLAGRTFQDGRPVLPAGTAFPEGDPETHGKRWLEKRLPGYRPTRDQRPLTELMDVGLIRSRRLRSFARFEHAIEQIAGAVEAGTCITSPV